MSDTVHALRNAIDALAAGHHATAAAIRGISLKPVEEGEEAVQLALAVTLGRIDGIGDRVRNHIRCAVAVIERDTAATLADACPLPANPAPPQPVVVAEMAPAATLPETVEEAIDTAGPPATTEETPRVILHSDAAGTYATHRLPRVEVVAALARDERPGGGKAKKAKKPRRPVGPAPSTNGQ